MDQNAVKGRNSRKVLRQSRPRLAPWHGAIEGAKLNVMATIAKLAGKITAAFLIAGMQQTLARRQPTSNELGKGGNIAIGAKDAWKACILRRFRRARANTIGWHLALGGKLGEGAHAIGAGEG